MIIVSQLLDTYYRIRLHSRKFRERAFKHAINNELRHSRSGRILIRNINHVMKQNPSFHNEVIALLNGKDYQEIFWESDLGYGWFEGNFGISNDYFEFAKKEIADKKYETLLDVGCGWGEFCRQCAAINCLKKITGIDISEKIINEAQQKSTGAKISYQHKTIFDITEKSDIITMFGSPDYMSPPDFIEVVKKALSLYNKEIVMLNSLRGVPFEDAFNSNTAKEIRRYDLGYVHPMNYILKGLCDKEKFNFKVIKYSKDAQMAIIFK